MVVAAAHHILRRSTYPDVKMTITQKSRSYLFFFFSGENEENAVRRAVAFALFSVLIAK